MPAAEPTATVSVEASYFDGRSARAHPVSVMLVAGELQITGPDLDLRMPARAVRWPERTRHGARIAQLPDGASLNANDAAAWDAWARASGLGDSWVVRAQQSWRGAAFGVLALVALLGVTWVWGVPVLGRAAVAVMPTRIDQALGDAALRAVDDQWMMPSTLPSTQQQQLHDALTRALAAQPRAEAPSHTLVFRRSKIGPNAFALPGGTIVLTDQLVMAVHNDTDTLVGVLAHELGHVKHRHGMRLLVQAGLISTVAGLVLGDFSTLLATVPVWLGQASYSRDAEREADAHALQVLTAAGISPLVMVTLFDKLAVARHAGASPENGAVRALGIAIASHPPDAERIAFFKAAAPAR
jgi:Zn-dependent protease with chaperone function